MLLAVDTCSTLHSVALAVDEEIRVAAPSDSSARADRVARVIGELLEDAGVAARDLTGLGVTVGPGSYTGVRVGLALIRGLSLVDQIPVVAVGSLDLLALSAPLSKGRICALLGATTTTLYVAVYERDLDDVVELLAPRVVERGEIGGFIRAQAPGAAVVCCEAQRDATSEILAAAVAPARRAARLAEVAAKRLAAGRGEAAAAVLPLYVGASGARRNRNKVAFVAGDGE